MEREIDVSLMNMGTVNKNRVTITTEKGSVDLYFSYSTLVGINGTVSENIWSVTTGKMLNELEPNKKLRVPHDIVIRKAQEKLRSIL